MRIELPFGDETKVLNVPLPAGNLTVAKSRNPEAAGTWAQVVGEALSRPFGAREIRQEALAGKKVAVITDDWGRPTPAAEVVPLILDELAAAGARDEDITFLTASGMHNPMSQEDLARKLGTETVARYRCISHDGGDWDKLAFVGISPQGTPVWVNRHVAEADYKIVLGRIYLHEALGYEGGYKMILPGVSAFETIARDHSFNFSATSIAGVHDNPSRREADAVGALVGVDFLINVVVSAASAPIRAFCGEVMEAHARGIEYGDREVWGALVPGRADIVVTSPGSGAERAGDCDLETLYRAARVAKDQATIIGTAAEPRTIEPERYESALDENAANDAEALNAMLQSLSTGDLLRLHEKRDWTADRRDIQWRIKAVRGEFYRRRKHEAVCKRRVVLTPDPDAALQEALSRFDGREAQVTILPEGRTTMPKQRLFEYSRHG